MTTSQSGIPEATSSFMEIPDVTAKSPADDDFVILEPCGSVMDSGMSVSSVQEKQAFESLEKPSEDSSLGASSINVLPYYKKSRFKDVQYRLERKRGYFGEGSEECEEKQDEPSGEKTHVQDLEVKEEDAVINCGEMKDEGFESHDTKKEQTLEESKAEDDRLTKDTKNIKSLADVNDKHDTGEIAQMSSAMPEERAALAGQDRQHPLSVERPGLGESEHIGGGKEDRVEGRQVNKQNKTGIDVDEMTGAKDTMVDVTKGGQQSGVNEGSPAIGNTETTQSNVGGVPEVDLGRLTNGKIELLQNAVGTDDGGGSGSDSHDDHDHNDGKDYENPRNSYTAQSVCSESQRMNELHLDDRKVGTGSQESSLPGSGDGENNLCSDDGKQHHSQSAQNGSRKVQEPENSDSLITTCSEDRRCHVGGDGIAGLNVGTAQVASGRRSRHGRNGGDDGEERQEDVRLNDGNSEDRPTEKRLAKETSSTAFGEERPGFRNGGQNDCPDGEHDQNVQLGSGNNLRRRRRRSSPDSRNDEFQENGKDNRPPEARVKQRGFCCSVLVLGFKMLLALTIFIFVFSLMLPTPPVPSPHKPTVEINAKKHVSPSSSTWKLGGRCLGFNSSYVITHCLWKQIHPKPTSAENTVIPDGAKDCPIKSTGMLHDIDATFTNLKVPKELGNYIFELHCTDSTGNANEKRVDIWVNELIPPIITIASEKITTSTSNANVSLPGASCRAVQGKIIKEGWTFIDGPKEINEPSKGGIVQIKTPGKYKFKYKCTDSYDGTASSANLIVVAKPNYVLGIDLGTTTSCIVFIRENGTTQDINIYGDESDTDSCMPSVVAFRHGELLIGEKALQQSVLNPLSTIYEVKRLMGRSYYDDAHHTFNYKVRPTLKSHSLKGVRAAVEIPCDADGRKKLLPPELVSALILRQVADHAQDYLKVLVKDVVISVPAQFDDAQRKATMDAGLIAGLNPIKIVNEPTVAAFAANDITKEWLDAERGTNVGVKKSQNAVWAVVADIGGGTTDYALMQISGTYYKVITTDGDKTLGGRDIDIELAKRLTEIFREKYPSLDLDSPLFKQKLRLECEKAKIILSEKEKYAVTVDYTDDEHSENLPLGHMLSRSDFESYVLGILKAMVAPLDSLLGRSGGVSRGNIEHLYLVGGTSKIPKLKELLLDYFSNVKKENVRHKDPVQLVSRGAAAFGAALSGLVDIEKTQMPKVDVIPLPISIAVDMDDMHVIFERNRLYPCIENRDLTTFTDSQTAIAIKVYEGEGRSPNECHFLGEFELSGIPPQPKGIPAIRTTFRVDTNGILRVRATCGDVVKAMTLDVYSKSGGMIGKTRQKLSSLLNDLMIPVSNHESKCSLLDTATEMSVIPPKPNSANVLKLSVDSQYDSVKTSDPSNPEASLTSAGMITVSGLVTDYDSARKEADLDIVLVIDESGSMAGTPIETMRKVILRLVDLLKDNHRLGIVSYSHSVNRRLELAHCNEENKDLARNIVRRITARGATNLYGGLLSGLQMAYHGRRRSRVLLFTDGYANVGTWINSEDIIREIIKSKASLMSLTTAQVTLSTFGYLGNHDEYLLQQLAANVGGGTYNYLSENTAMATGFGHVLGDAINIVAEKIHLAVVPLNDVLILKAITNFSFAEDSGNMTFDIPSTADQQSRHILLELAVPPTKEKKAHDALFRVELAYMNTITEREEGSEEYLIVARTSQLDEETRSRDVDEQLNRVHVARMIAKALESLKDDRKLSATKLLREAERFVLKSISKDHTLSLCLCRDLSALIADIESGDLNNAMKSLQDSLTSHWQEKGGRSSCYLTRKEDKLISILKS